MLPIGDFSSDIPIRQIFFQNPWLWLTALRACYVGKYFQLDFDRDIHFRALQFGTFCENASHYTCTVGNRAPFPDFVSNSWRNCLKQLFVKNIFTVKRVVGIGKLVQHGRDQKDIVATFLKQMFDMSQKMCLVLFISLPTGTFGRHVV